MSDTSVGDSGEAKFVPFRFVMKSQSRPLNEKQIYIADLIFSIVD